jgi:hypothetical protein
MEWLENQKRVGAPAAEQKDGDEAESILLSIKKKNETVVRRVERD